jgi:hypothetical protein
VRLAEAAVSINKKRVVVAGLVRRDRHRRRVGELIGGADDERIERIIVIAGIRGGLRRGGLRRFGGIDAFNPHRDREAERLLKAAFEQIAVFLADEVLLEFGIDAEPRDVVFEPEGNDVPDPEIVRHLGHLGTAVIAD